MQKTRVEILRLSVEKNVELEKRDSASDETMKIFAASLLSTIKFESGRGKLLAYFEMADKMMGLVIRDGDHLVFFDVKTGNRVLLGEGLSLSEPISVLKGASGTIVISTSQPLINRLIFFEIDSLHQVSELQTPHELGTPKRNRGDKPTYFLLEDDQHKLEVLQVFPANGHTARAPGLKGFRKLNVTSGKWSGESYEKDKRVKAFLTEENHIVTVRHRLKKDELVVRDVTAGKDLYVVRVPPGFTNLSSEWKLYLTHEKTALGTEHDHFQNRTATWLALANGKYFDLTQRIRDPQKALIISKRGERFQMMGSPPLFERIAEIAVFDESTDQVEEYFLASDGSPPLHMVNAKVLEVRGEQIVFIEDWLSPNHSLLYFSLAEQIIHLLDKSNVTDTHLASLRVTSDDRV